MKNEFKQNYIFFLNKNNGNSEFLKCYFLKHLFSFTKEDLVKHIRKRTIQTGRLFFSPSLS